MKGAGLITLLEIISKKYKLFSKQQRVLADYVQNNLVDVAFMSITELSKKTHVGTATITRFTKELGYSSFARFQNEVKMLAKKEIAPIKEFKVIIKEEPATNILYDKVQESIAALSELYNRELNKALEAASKTLCKAAKIYILASRSSFSVAYYLYFSLKRFQENIILIENRNDDLSVTLQYVTKEDVLVAISYPSYTKFTVDIAQYFIDRHAKVVSITDQYTAPVAAYSTHLLVVKNRLKIYFVTTMAVINALIAMMGKINPQIHVATFSEENDVTKKLNVYTNKD